MIAGTETQFKKFEIMKSLKELNIKIVRSQTKEGNAEIKDLHHKINDIIYKYQYQYITKGIGERILNEFITLGTELSNTEAQGNAVRKKEEILSQLRNYVRILKKYEPTTDKREQVLKRFVSDYIKRTKEDKPLETDEVIDLLKRQRELVSDYAERKITDTGMAFKVPQSFAKLNAELAERLKDSFTIRFSME